MYMYKYAHTYMYMYIRHRTAFELLVWGSFRLGQTKHEICFPNACSRALGAGAAGAAAAGPNFDVPTKIKWRQGRCRLRMGWEYSYSMPIAAVDVNMAEQFRPTKVFSMIVQFENRDYYSFIILRSRPESEAEPRL